MNQTCRNFRVNDISMCFRVGIPVCGTRCDQTLLQEQVGGVRVEWIPVAQKTGGSENQADRRLPGQAPGTAGGTHHR